jgi:ElaB/YqjD/DUF883 family membrane-anchored ribosome-binding protein
MTTPRNGTSTIGTHAGEKLDERIDQIKDGVKAVVDTAEARAYAIKERAIEVKAEAISRGSAVIDRATAFIKANPFKAVGIAFGLGYVGMRLVRR